MVRAVRAGLVLGVIGAIVAAVVRVLRGPPAPAFSVPAPVRPVPAPSPPPAEPTVVEAVIDEATDAARATADGQSALAWVEPVEGACPVSHPVKAKLSSGIYHQPGGLSYARTAPDRCYSTADAAEADGLRAAKR